MKVLLILVDGMRPDAMKDLDEAKEFMKKSAYTLNGTTVFPSITLPCHMSLFHSVEPARHGTTTNIYTPQVRPIDGLCEELKKNNKTGAFFYDWEELRDLSRPESLIFSYFVSEWGKGLDAADEILANKAIKYLAEDDCADFVFLYFGSPDGAGHSKGWMSDEYLEAVEKSWKRIQRVTETLNENYTVIITADHGGHERIHGENIPEDMTIPILIHGKDFQSGTEIHDANIIDIAPTIAKLLGVAPAKEWEGKSLL